MSAERHYSYTMGLFEGQYGAETEKFVYGVLLAGLIILLGMLSARKISSPEARAGKLVPDTRFRVFDFFDIFFEAFIKFHDSILGKENRKYISLTSCIFLFLFLANLLALVPGMPAITTTVWINVGVALVVFVAFNYYGIREQGLISYLKHFTGIGELINSSVSSLKEAFRTRNIKALSGFSLAFIAVVALAGSIFAIEIFSTCLRVATLNLRLYWNISADHKVLNAFNGFFIFYFLGLFVSFVQAFVFTILSMIYILLATQHEEH